MSASLAEDIKLYAIPDGASHSSLKIPLPDSFFTLSSNDAKTLVQTQSEVRKISDTLMTKSLREQKMKELLGDKKKKYDKVVVRIRFPDSLLLQATFPSDSKIITLYSFIEEHLEKARSYSLCMFNYLTLPIVTPPRTELKTIGEKTFANSNFCPAVLVHFSSPNSNGPYLKKETLNLKVPLPTVADDFSDVTDLEGSTHTSTKKSPTLSEKLKLKAKSNAPKWLKLRKDK